MQFLKRLIFYTAIITTFTLLACAVWITMEVGGKGLSLQADFLPTALLWQILFTGVVCMLVTVALVYVAVAIMAYLRDKSTADKINERLERFHRSLR